MSPPIVDPGAAASADSGVFGLPHSVDEAQVVLVPVPFEATTSYGRGTAAGPRAILEASRQVDLHDLETGDPWEAGIHLLPEDPRVLGWNARASALAEPVIAAAGAGGDPALLAACREVDAVGAEVNGWVQATVEGLLAKGKLVGTIGGDHSTPFGAIAAHAARHPGMGILHVDAHADLRLAYEGFAWSHASIMRNVVERLPNVGRVVQVGIRDLSAEELGVVTRSGGRVVLHSDFALASALADGQPFARVVDRIVDDLPAEVYVSFDIDGLDPALCPHTGTPVPGGLSWREACQLLAGIGRSGRRVVGFDLTEVAPGPDGDEWDANVGARLCYKLVGWMLRTLRR